MDSNSDMNSNFTIVKKYSHTFVQRYYIIYSFIYVGAQKYINNEKRTLKSLVSVQLV